MTYNQLWQVQQIRELENTACLQYGLTAADLMARAGAAALRELQQHWPTAQSILVVCGKGNNAGDGYVVAKLAKQCGLKVTVLAVTPIAELTGAALAAAEECLKLGVAVGDRFTQVDVIVDALLGTGLVGPVSSVFKAAITNINATQLPVLALDVPSGLVADTGNIEEVAVSATVTVTFLGMKRGLFTGYGPNVCGIVKLATLELPLTIYDKFTPQAAILEYRRLRQALPKRDRSAHKGNFGHVLVVGGDYGFSGAVRMAGEAALRVGAGLVSIFTRDAHLPALNAMRPELMCHGDQHGKLKELLQRATVVVVGPGLGTSGWGRKLLAQVLAVSKPLVVDADALNGLQGARDNWVLTPHPGEAARLLQVTVREIQANRFLAAQQLSNKWGGVCVLKGAGTLVAKQQSIMGLCRFGNPGMASGGMGDILSGIIGGLIAQKMSQEAAAKLGVLLHAMAGDSAVCVKGEQGLLAMDLLDYLPLC